MLTKCRLLCEEVSELFFKLPDSRLLDEETIVDLLKGVDISELAQAVRHNAQTVYAYTTDGTGETFRYRSSELFGGMKATKVYGDLSEGSGICWAETPESTALSVYSSELWLTEDLTFHCVACVSTKIGENGFCCEYREDKGSPVDVGVDIPLNELADALGNLCEEYVHCGAPTYEM